ncbi:sigma-70 region 2 family protein [Aspergillus vadensis CBS 113365]|uniref:Sigma-70 region 2 family protein n=1 Tax=Aspergillus vadensis (strain CBS 113365 / IMI 142717 / IBT 24658) TaxID=1448311 RepID=A0A319BTQ8_ASPVC|nr:sigma-70 region 2 family protein [Aspergillus vadensis CBS 113365]PYH74889.1 sigma-70 region 2 family protein [Aspergillus vadensis CBS 113365]
MPDESSSASGKKSTEEPPPIQWQFIDASDNSRSTLTRVKRHVMQEYMRQKRHATGQSGAEIGESPSQAEKTRQQQRAIGQATKTSENQTDNTQECGALYKTGTLAQENIPKPTRSDFSSQQESSGTVKNHATEGRVILGSKPAVRPFYEGISFRSKTSSPKTYCLSQSSISDTSTPTPSSSAPTTPADVALSPKTILSAARTDPFNTLPLELDIEGQRLFDFYVNEMPACSYGNHFRSPKAHNWYTAVFVPEGMKGPVAFQNTILVHAASTWVWVRNEEPDAAALYHRDRAITMLRELRDRNPDDISDEAIIGCISAAGLEDFDPRPGHKQISWLHMRAAREMVRLRGGPSAFHKTRLGMLINWQDYILSGYETEGPSFFFEYNPPSMLHRPVPQAEGLVSSQLPLSENSFIEHNISQHPIPAPVDEIENQCSEFISFLKRCEQLAIHQCTSTNLTTAPMRHTAFQSTSLLYQILAAPPGLRFTASGNRKQFVARLVALIMLNAGLWDYRNSVLHSEAFLRNLEQTVLNCEVNMSGSVEALLQILLACEDGSTEIPETRRNPGNTPDFTQYCPTAETPYDRPWFAGRMLKVAKRLSFDSWMNVNYFLFSCLTLHTGIPSVSLWEDGLRQEILSAPLTNYVMPALQGL